jgi:hypothetical protein
MQFPRTFLLLFSPLIVTNLSEKPVTIESQRQTSFVTAKSHLQLFNPDPINNNLSLEIITALDINYDVMVCEMSQKKTQNKFSKMTHKLSRFNLKRIEKSAISFIINFNLRSRLEFQLIQLMRTICSTSKTPRNASSITHSNCP